MTAEIDQMEIARNRLDKAARKLQKEALSIISEGGHDPLGQNRDRDTKKKLYAKKIVQRAFALLEKAYELKYFSKDVLRLQEMMAHPEKFKISAKRKSKAIVMMATNGINENLTLEQIADRTKVSRKTLSVWKRGPRYLNLKEMIWGTESTEE